MPPTSGGSTSPARQLLPLRCSREQVLQRGVQSRRNRLENHHSGIVDTPLEPPHDVRMNACIEREPLLSQVAPLAAFPDFLTKASQNRS